MMQPAQSCLNCHSRVAFSPCLWSFVFARVSFFVEPCLPLYQCFILRFCFFQAYLPHLPRCFCTLFLFRLQMRTQRELLGDAVAERGFAGFYYTENAAGTRFYSLLLPKNEKGTQVVRRGRHQVTLASYYRVVRPDTGMSFSNINIEVRVSHHLQDGFWIYTILIT